jgi:hypothetical protein
MLLASSLILGLLLDTTRGFLTDFDDVTLRRTELVVDGFVDTAACYGAIEASVAENMDNGGSRRMDADSYVTFVQLYGPDGFLEDVDAFADLPLILQSNFNILACLCQQNAEDRCCVGDNAAIETDGAFADETPTEAERSYLFLVCSLTGVTIDRVLQSSAPSSSPTATPYPTEAPTTTPAPTSTPAPTQDLTVEIEVSVSYEIGVRAGNSSDDCIDGLVGAMNSLAPQVLAETRRRQLRISHRRLRSVQLDTSIASIESIGEFLFGGGTK